MQISRAEAGFDFRRAASMPYTADVWLEPGQECRAEVHIHVHQQCALTLVILCASRDRESASSRASLSGKGDGAPSQ